MSLANQLLVQAEPGRTELLKAGRDEKGEVHFFKSQKQSDEFEKVVGSIATRLHGGASPEDIIVLVPRRKLGRAFADFANSNAESFGISAPINFALVLKAEFTERERQGILRFGLLVNPESILHKRAFIGIADEQGYAPELAALRTKYGSLRDAFAAARVDDCPRKQKRLRSAVQRIEELRNWLMARKEVSNVDEIIDELFPSDSGDVADIRNILLRLREDDDTLASLYTKFVDYIRTLPSSNHTVRVMSLMASKGLEADHIYIIGCNDGNIPGPNRSPHMSEHEHRAEQRRLLFVGVTRAKKSVTISWSRLIPYGQSKGQYTPGVKTVKIEGELWATVGSSAFLQDLKDLQWE